MSSKLKGRRMKYPYSKTVAYWCAVVTVLSIVFVLLLIQDFLLLICYFVSTPILALIIFKLKLYFLFQVKESESLENRNLKSQKWKRILVILSGFLIMGLPVILLIFLPPVSWFMCLNVFVSSLSLSEVVLFYYAQKS